MALGLLQQERKQLVQPLLALSSKLQTFQPGLPKLRAPAYSTAREPEAHTLIYCMAMPCWYYTMCKRAVNKTKHRLHTESWQG